MGDQIYCSPGNPAIKYCPTSKPLSFAINAVPGDIQYFVVIGVADQAPIAAIEEPAAGVEIHVEEAAVPPQLRQQTRIPIAVYINLSFFGRGQTVQGQAQAQGQTGLRIAEFDTNALRQQGSEFFDLTTDEGREEHLRTAVMAKNFARTSQEIVLKSNQPIHTIGHIYCPHPFISMKCKPSIGKCSCT